MTPRLVSSATKVVTFGCLDRCPIGAEGKAEDWPSPGAAGKTMDELRGIRDELARRVDDLIARSLGRPADGAGRSAAGMAGPQSTFSSSAAGRSSPGHAATRTAPRRP